MSNNEQIAHLIPPHLQPSVDLHSVSQTQDTVTPLSTDNPQCKPQIHSILKQARIYVCACTDDRIRRLPEQLEKLNLPYTLEKELLNPIKNITVLDNSSRRFRDQSTKDIDQVFMWLEDDINIPDNFWEIWNKYEATLPQDWEAAVIGWGLILDNGTKIRRAENGWWFLEKGVKEETAFCGAQAVLLNRGEWRSLLKNIEFRCDVGLHGALRQMGITKIYHTDKVLIGTYDPKNSFGQAVVTYETMSDIRYFGWETGYRTIRGDDFVNNNECNI